MMPVAAIVGEIAEKVEKVKEVTEVAISKVERILVPDMEVIKTSTLEAIVEANAEKTEVAEATETGWRALTEDEKRRIQELTHMSDKTIERCMINEDGTIRIRCINEEKLGEASEVPYVEKTIEVNGVKIQVVVPEFPVDIFETVLPDELLLADDEKVFSYCTEQLKQAIENNPELASKFTEEQLDQIINGSPRIKGYTWHHCAETGRMQLVPTSMHTTYRHTGGKAIWGGGR